MRTRTLPADTHTRTPHLTPTHPTSPSAPHPLQTHRTRVSDEFRRRLRCVMFSSDVSARGVDYPDVSLVVQVGAAGGAGV